MTRLITRRDFIKTGVSASAALLIGCSIKNRFDVIIKNGMVLDGGSSDFKEVDIGITGNKIAAFGDLKDSSADQIIDASGLVVSPGFIDIHTHTDTELLINPKAESKVHQGVTTEISGNCGYTPFPLSDAKFSEMDESIYQKYGIHVSWRHIAGFLEALEAKRISMNYATFTGHGTLRNYVVGGNDVQPTTEQLQTMKKLLAESMEAGSFGLSTGLEYAPGSYANKDELIELCRLVSKQNGLYATHMRNEDDRVEEAIKEALDISKAADVPLQISHLKACNQNNWHKVDRMLEMIHDASQKGLPVHADRYPYTAWSTGLSSLLPLWSRQGTTDEILARLQDKELLPKIREYAKNRGKKIGGWDRLLINSCYTDQNKKFEGKSISACSEMTGVSPFEFVRKLMIDEKSRVDITGFAMEEGNLEKVLASPLVMVGSDGSAVAPYGKLGEGKPHPRFYGTFPRVLGKYFRHENLFDLPTAVKKMTSLPAEKMGLKQRGKLKKGYFADVVVFNPATVIDNATFLKPHQYPTGIEYVIVNGKMTINKGKHTGELTGSVLRKT